MKTEEFEKHDWALVLIVSVVFIAALARGLLPPVDSLELRAYDLGVTMTHRMPGAADRVAVVAIDDQSIQSVGRWPWPRTVLATALDKLNKADVSAVALLVPLTEAQVDPGLESIHRILDQLGEMDTPEAAKKAAPHSAASPGQRAALRAALKTAREQMVKMRGLLSRAEGELDADAALTKAAKRASRLYLPVTASVGDPPGAPGAQAPEPLRNQRLKSVTGRKGAGDATKVMLAPVPPLPQFAEQAFIGPMGFAYDSDGGVRSVYTVLKYGDDYYASLPVQLAAGALGARGRSVEAELGSGVRLDGLFVPVDHRERLYGGFYGAREGGGRAFATYSFQDLLADKVKPAALRNKIVLVGLAATGAGARFVTPITPQEPLMTEAELTANVIAGVLNQDFYRRSPRMFLFEAALMIAIVCYLIFAFPRLTPSIAAIVTLVSLAALLGAEQYLLVSQRVWLRAVSPAALLALGHFSLRLKRYFLAARLWITGETDIAQNNRLLGLALQAQGQLDMAMDKFRRLPPENESLDLMYNLALDFERKRDFHKAAMAYRHILERRPKFRDAADRLKRSQAAENTVMLGTPPVAGGTLILDGAAKPTLGRYTIERELGRGAMGAVYLGRDPKINREVAIKTLAISQEFDADQVADVRKRFFREAETAGRLHHPNIVTIYDVGEERDLAYIAMEYVPGKTLENLIKPGKGLPIDLCVNVALKVADALTYAHEQGIVHRDIKPPNILCPDGGKTVKVADFGIARILATSKTSSDVILGTPAYMSPEQLTSAAVDGRSDLFSLGVTIFEMTTGHKPFSGDSLAALAYQIPNAPTPDIRKLRSDAPLELVSIIQRLMEKTPARRYQSGDQVKKDLKRLRSEKAI